MEPLITITEEPWIKKLPEIEVTKVNHRSKKQPKYKNPFVYKKYKKPNPKYVENVEDEDKYNIGSSSKNVKWACMICSEIKVNKLELIQHYEFHKLETEKLKKGSGKADGGDFFVCPACLTEFTSLKGYEKHVELHHGEKQYRCNLCKKSFKTLFIQCIHNFNVHNDAEDVAEYECIPCGYTTEDQKILKQHIKELHEENVKYRCEICQNGFSSLQWYEEHKNFHTGAMPFKCDECGKSFMYTRYLVAHQKSMHQADVSVSHECETCNKKFAHKKSLVLHMRGHTGGNAVLCDICGKSLSSTEHLKQHIRIHTGFKPHCCSVCGKGFAKKCNLTLHERVHSGEKPHTCNVCGKSFSQRSTLVIHGRYHSGERPYVCQLCNKGFVAKGLLGVHMKTCPGLMGPGYSHLDAPKKKTKPNNATKTSQLKTKITRIKDKDKPVKKRKNKKGKKRKSDEGKYKCSTCTKSFRSRYLLIVHNFNHHSKDDNYYCIDCDYDCTSEKDLRHHLREAHEEHVKYRCDICNKGFTTKTWYEEHANFHTGATPFQCEICSKSFPYTRYLNSHRRSMHHDIYSPTPITYECKLCNKKFAHKKSLRIHNKGHTGEGAVLCYVCGKSISSNDHLKQHMRIHTGYKPHVCGVCGKGFCKKYNLTLHERVHSGEKPHLCNVCGKAFSQRSTLVIHVRSHSGDVQHSCDACNKSFISKSLLNMHKKSCLGYALPPLQPNPHQFPYFY